MTEKNRKNLNIDPALYALAEKGLEIGDFDRAISIMEELSPFHLEQYGLQYYMANEGKYKEGTTLELLYENYKADRAVKNFLFDYLAELEVKLRNVLSAVIQDQMGNFGYLDHRNFKNHEYHENFLNEVNSEMDRANEPFVKKELKKYDDNLPIYMVTEIITFGGLSRLYDNLKDKDMARVSAYYAYPDYKDLSRNLDALADVRNTCAHHGRLSYREFKDSCHITAEDKRIIEDLCDDRQYRINPNALFANILCMVRLLRADRAQDLIKEFDRVFKDYPDFRPEWMNFPNNWKQILDEII